MSQEFCDNNEVNKGAPAETENELQPKIYSTTPEFDENERYSPAETVPSDLDNEHLNAAKENLNGNEKLLDASNNLGPPDGILPNSNETDFYEEILKLDKLKHDKSCVYFAWRDGENILDEQEISYHLDELTNDELKVLYEEIQDVSSNLSLENEIFEFILHEDEAVQNTLKMVEIDQELPSQDYMPTLSYAEKCCFAQKKLEHLQKELNVKETDCNDAVQNLKFKLESLNISLKELKEEKTKFDANIRYGGKHPVSKKVILQKVLKYFDDSIRSKMEMSIKFKVQMQHDTMEQNKILNQVKTKQKRLASLNITEFQQAEFAHKNACATLTNCKEQLAKCKSKLSPLIQDLAKLKKDLEKEKGAMEEMKNAVLKQEHLKEIMLVEKVCNDQKMSELEASMRKIRLDPRRHNLPQIIDYAAAKRENEALKKSIKSWQKKVARVELLSKIKKKPLQNSEED